MQGGLAFVLLGWSWLAGFIAYRHAKWLEASAGVLACAVLALTAHTLSLSVNWPVTLVIVAVAMGLGDRLRGPRRLGQVLNLLGDASYPLYLFHLPFFLILAGLKLPWTGLGYLGAAVLLGVVLDRCFDQPIKHLARHLWPRLR
jgi:peptidoglycan/LPS O-acetylase OafA/YrhL